MHSSLRREGVQIPVQRRSRYPTSLALVTTNANKQLSYTLYRKGIADTDITFSEIATQLPADLTVLHTGSLAITPDQLPKIRELMQLAAALNRHQFRPQHSTRRESRYGCLSRRRPLIVALR